MVTAALVIDMQNGFCRADGSLPRAGFGLPRIDTVIRNNAAMIDAVRAAGMPVVFTRHVFRPDLVDVPARMMAALPPGTTPLVRGSRDAEIVTELAPLPGDRVIMKNRYDAFLYTDLELVLRLMGVRRLLVSGVVTNACVEATVRSAEQRDFEVSVAADCASAPDAAHEAALASMAVFATVGPWRELLAGLQAGSAPAGATT
ncbi:isochorismatase family cysteine hydrolase [Actinoallomurus sp. NPDC050550]|uniref:cysteine hydrolase family protein n=1 Tax=Actinoallomurus sp. NPDC050550 TaxID=3154937 RepID=UPI0033C6E1C8